MSMVVWPTCGKPIRKTVSQICVESIVFAVHCAWIWICEAIATFAFWVQPLHWSGSCEKVCVFWEKSECFWTSVLLERAENTKEHSAVCCSPGRGRLTIWLSLIGNVVETRGVFLTDSAFPHSQSYQVAFTVLYMWPDTAAFCVFRQVELFFLNETLFFFHVQRLEKNVDIIWTELWRFFLFASFFFLNDQLEWLPPAAPDGMQTQRPNRLEM